MDQVFAEGQIDISLPDRVTERFILPYVLVADEAFQLTNYMMRLFPGKEGTVSNKRKRHLIIDSVERAV